MYVALAGLDVIERQTAISSWPDAGTDAAFARLFVMGPLAGHLERRGDEVAYVPGLTCTGTAGTDGTDTSPATCITCRTPLSFDDGTHTHPACESA